MDNLSLVEQLLKDIEEISLSNSIPRVLPIALECKDYKGYCVLSQLINPVADNMQTNIIQTNEIVRTLLIQGIPKDDIAKILAESKEEFIEIKTIGQDQVSSHGVKEIETWLPEAKATLDSVTSTTHTSYQELTLRITQIRRLYEVIRGYVISKLTYYQQVLKNMNSREDSKESVFENKKLDMKKVFVVHGHNGEMKESVARLIEKQKIQAIILHEQANKGDTIIEKFERNSDVGCAVCLFTADDVGHAKNVSEEKMRARQNVVFETGYFIGKLGREKVILIADPNIEIPSDLQGIVYTDSGDWRFSVLKELKAMGYSISYDKLDN